MTQVKAYLKYLRMSPRKVRLVIGVIKGKMAVEAEELLPFVKQHASRPILKLLKSAMANAENNFKLKAERMYIKDLRADAAPTLKRSMPRAHGRAAPIRKRGSHLTIILEDIAQKQVKGKMKIEKKSDEKKGDKEIKREKSE
ncbi:MAG TPA: 50S ribosomal protein L22 [Patescibacteria group bacterium]|nr:50S ribosomal protein L22 [Patescibacteria group bacterium]HLD61784.1 50S ribosomal protein L22 [Patescibacteria group bacterium]